MNVELLREILMTLIPLLAGVTVHEFAHARVALWLGDDTAARLGRVTLNPVSHMDPLGSLLLPILSVISHSGLFFAWGKPVPVAPVRFRRTLWGKPMTMRLGHALVSAAGPAANLVLAILGTVLFRVLLRVGVLELSVLMLVHQLVIANFLLMLFNLIPFPPLDGFTAWGIFLPGALGKGMEKLQENTALGWFILITLVATGAISRILRPAIGWLVTGTDALFSFI